MAKRKEKNTPGPWEVRFHDNKKAALIGSHDSICAMRKSGDYTQEEFEANAALIGAAPELRDSLKELLAVELKRYHLIQKHPNIYPELHARIKLARAALRKAKPKG